MNAEEVIAPYAGRLAEHIVKARTKHPFFCDRLFPDRGNAGAGPILTMTRTQLAKEGKRKDVSAYTIALCEMLEAEAAVDDSSRVDELYDVAAVVIRMIDAVEGRQNIGRSGND